MTLQPYENEHANPAGPGDQRPTAMQVLKDQDLIDKMKGFVILVTGATSGLGIETAKSLRATGADVYITARSQDKATKALEEIRSTSSGAGKLDAVVIELDSLDSVRNGAAEFLKKSSNKLNILITNAGVMACPESATKDGFEMQFGTNHVAHFLLFQLVKPALLASSTAAFNSRVVSVSSSGHRLSTIQFGDLNLKKQGYSEMKAYGQSKIANVYFANELDRRYGAKGLHAVSLHPGVILTPLARHIDPKRLDEMRALPGFEARSKSPEQGAATQVWAAVAKELEGWGGKYLDDVGVAGPQDPNGGMGAPGHAAHAYDEAAEKQLWTESLKMVGLTDSD